MTDTIVAKVAAVMDDTTLVLNAGSHMGVKEGMLFDVVAEHQEITDPDTGESLGRWEVAKARVVVTHVQERMSTVRAPLVVEAETSGTLSTLMVRHSFGLYGEREGNRNPLDVRTGGMATGSEGREDIEADASLTRRPETGASWAERHRDGGRGWKR